MNMMVNKSLDLCTLGGRKLENLQCKPAGKSLNVVKYEKQPLLLLKYNLKEF